MPFLDSAEKYVKAREATDDNIIKHMRMTCCITKAIYIHSRHLISSAFPWQPWLHECASMLCLHLQCLPCCNTNIISERYNPVPSCTVSGGDLKSSALR
jgi:hypothetical protein